MTRKEFDERFLRKGVNCLTRESAIEFIELAKKFGYIFYANVEDTWSNLRSDTCFILTPIEPYSIGASHRVMLIYYGVEIEIFEGEK